MSDQKSKCVSLSVCVCVCVCVYVCVCKMNLCKCEFMYVSAMHGYMHPYMCIVPAYEDTQASTQHHIQ